jgi:SAM-dependent methyltransferase
VRAIERVHQRAVVGRRARVLAAAIAPWLPGGARTLDVGAGDGRIAREIVRARPDVSIRAVDVFARPGAAVPVDRFDGRHLPVADRAVDVVLLVDVLHHADDPVALLGEARRAAGSSVIVKDHLADAFGAIPTLRLMDRVGNARHGVSLPYTYWRRDEWNAAFAACDLAVTQWSGRLGLYPAPLSWVFERSLHFLAQLAPVGSRLS